MDYEKKYKKLVSKIEKAYLYAQTDSTKAVLEEICPELKESEGERIREQIISFIEEYGNPAHCEWQKEWIAWLEKQGGQKPAWNEEDECYMSECIGAIATKDGWSSEEKRKTKHWLKSLKQKQVESKWIEEDSKMLGTLIAIFEVNYPDGFYKVNPIGTTDMQGIHSSEIVKWLKTIKQRMEE